MTTLPQLRTLLQNPPLAHDQSCRYAVLSLVEEDLVKNGKHVLVAFSMMPIADYDYPATAAHWHHGERLHNG